MSIITPLFKGFTKHQGEGRKTNNSTLLTYFPIMR